MPFTTYASRRPAGGATSFYTGCRRFRFASKELRMKRLAVAFVAVIAVARCGSPSGGGAVPKPGSPNRVPDKPGVVKFFNDTFGDPVPTGITTGPDGALWFTDQG